VYNAIGYHKEVTDLRLEVGESLKNPGQSYPFQGELTIAEELEVLGDPVSFADIAVSGTFTGAGNGVGVRCEVRANATSRCALCLAPVTVPLSCEVNAAYMRNPDPTDPDLYPLDGHSIELDEAVREALLLELPIRFLCKTDCKGLCPVCGTNLNLTGCECAKTQVAQGPLAALRDLRIQNEEV
jgi:uncharacterized protein